MHHGSWWTSGVIAAVGLVLGLGVARVSQAQQPAGLDFDVTENRLPGADGTGTITPLPNNQIRVDIRLTGMPPNGEHAAHIHTAQGARCDTNAPVTYPLTNVRVDAAGVGTSSTTVTLTADRPVQANNAYVNVHQGATPPGAGVVCANVTTSFTASGGTAPTAGQPQAAGQAAALQSMPRTGSGGPQGDTPSGWMAAGLASLLVLLGSAGVVAMRRRQ